MAETNKNDSKSILLNTEKILKSINVKNLQDFSNAIEKEIGNYELNKKEKELLQEIMSVDAMSAAKWKTIADVLGHINVFAFADNNPEMIRLVVEVFLGIIGFVYPVANTANGLLTKVPDGLFSLFVRLGGYATPDYLLYLQVKKHAENKAEKARLQAEQDAAESENKTTLIIVCKNKLLSAEMSKLIKLEDDLDEEIVGTKDGTVHTIIWNEAAWEEFGDKLTSENRVLVIGKIKNTMKLTREQIRYEKFGVKYGWNNNIATIEADPKVLKGTKNYNEFLSAVNALQVSEKLKKNANFKFDWLAVGKLAIFPPLLLVDALRETPAIREQQLLFGLYTFYMQDLTEFLSPVK